MLMRTFTAGTVLAASISSVGACDVATDDVDTTLEPELEAEDAAEVGGEVISEVVLSNEGLFKFVALPDEAGVVNDVGVLYLAQPGGPSLAELGAEDLNPLELFYALTDDDSAPEVLIDLYDGGTQTRGWLAEAIEATPQQRYTCDDTWFLARHGNLQTGYNHHDGPHSGAWLNWWTNSYTAWTRNNIDRVKMGFCIQDAPDYSHIYFKYRPPGQRTWSTAYESYYLPDGAYVWWYCNSCTDYDWSERTEPVSWGRYDMGFDWS